MSQLHTHSAGTITTEGFIPHLFNPQLGIYMPVMIQRPRTIMASEWKKPPRPVKENSRYVFALPGGGRYVDRFPTLRAL